MLPPAINGRLQNDGGWLLARLALPRIESMNFDQPGLGWRGFG